VISNAGGTGEASEPIANAAAAIMRDPAEGER